MRFPLALCLIASALALSACEPSVRPVMLGNLSPPAADLMRQPEPVEPDPAIADEAAYDRYTDAVLAWGRGLFDQVGRLAAWAATAAAPATPKP